MKLEDIKNEEDLSKYAMSMYEDSLLFTHRELYDIELVLDEWAGVEYDEGFHTRFESIEELREHIEEFIQEDYEIVKKNRQDNE